MQIRSSPNVFCIAMRCTMVAAQATASQAAATAAAATAAAAAAKSTADAWKGKEPRSRNMTRQGTSLAFQGLRSVHLVERVRCIAPLQRLFQNWVQQLYQLLVKYSHMEVGVLPGGCWGILNGNFLLRIGLFLVQDAMELGALIFKVAFHYVHTRLFVNDCHTDGGIFQRKAGLNSMVLRLQGLQVLQKFSSDGARRMAAMEHSISTNSSNEKLQHCLFWFIFRGRRAKMLGACYTGTADQALQTALELVVLHGGFLELVDSILKGTHYTLAVRGLHASALGQGSVLPDNAISRADSVASSQASEWMMGWQQEQVQMQAWCVCMCVKIHVYSHSAGKHIISYWANALFKQHPSSSPQQNRQQLSLVWMLRFAASVKQANEANEIGMRREAFQWMLLLASSLLACS
eukprot:925245-Pelagomonas_calceolata.AAC.9